MTVRNIVSQPLLMQLVEECIKIDIGCKTLHETDAENTCGSTYFHYNHIGRVCLCAHLPDILFGSTKTSLPYIAEHA